eukprot:8227631-Pyramimonas_sp.AAC.1
MDTVDHDPFADLEAELDMRVTTQSGSGSSIGSRPHASANPPDGPRGQGCLGIGPHLVSLVAAGCGQTASVLVDQVASSSASEGDGRGAADRQPS